MEQKIEFYKEALIIPAVNDFKNNTRNFVHGIYSPKEGFLKSHIRFDCSLVNTELQSSVALEDSAYLHGNWFYAGALHHHFGHFLSECIHRLWHYCENKDSFDGIIYLPVAGFPKTIPKYIQDIFEIFSIPLSKIKVINKLTKVAHVVTAAPGSQLGSAPEKWYEAKLSNIINLKEYLDSDDLHIKKNNIVLSRANFKLRGRIAGFDYFSEVLSMAGYYIFNQEEYTVKEQIHNILGADKIVFEEGSAIHILEMIPEKYLRLKKVALIKRRINERHYANLISSKFESSIIYNQIEEKYIVDSHVNCMSVFKDPEHFNNTFLKKFENNINEYNMFKFMRHEYLDITDYILNKK